MGNGTRAARIDPNQWLADPSLDERFDEIARLLDVHYGPRALSPNGDPARELAATILSQSTTDRNSGEAFRSLVQAFPHWDAVIDAPVSDVANAIRTGGLADQKAPRVQHALRAMRDLAASGARLEAMSVEEAMAWLTGLDGVGPKTAACVLLFALGMPILPVDTHVGRVMTRLGIVPDRTSTATKQHILTQLAGPDPTTIYAVHVETIEHGRRVCLSRRPRCGACFLQNHCAFYLQSGAA